MSKDHVFKSGDFAIVTADHLMLGENTLVRVLDTPDSNTSFVAAMNSTHKQYMVPNDKLMIIHQRPTETLESLANRIDDINTKLDRVEELLQKIDVSLCEG